MFLVTAILLVIVDATRVDQLCLQLPLVLGSVCWRLCENRPCALERRNYIHCHADRIFFMHNETRANYSLVWPGTPLTVIIQGSSKSLPPFDSSLQSKQMEIQFTLEKILIATHESEFSDSVSLSSLRWVLHFLYLSIRSTKYEFFLAFLMKGNRSKSFAVGLYKI